MKKIASKPYNRYRQTLAWIGFVVIYLVLPILLAVGLSSLYENA